MLIRLAAAAALLCVGASAACAQEFGPGAMGRGGAFPFQGGEAIYKGVCQGCHMPDARGAVGAGAYPSLVKDPKLEVAGYPVAVILHGQKAMPVLGKLLTDQQVADVTNYLRSHFGNAYKDKVTAADVKTQR